MDIPPPDQWIKLSALARKLGRSYSTIYDAAKRGVRHPTENKRVYLKTWRTAGGIITTRDEVEQYFYAISPKSII